MITPTDCARQCEAEIVRLCRPEERDYFRAYAGREIAKVLREQRLAQQWLKDFAWYLRACTEIEALLAAREAAL